jgi:hypothetical protein
LCIEIEALDFSRRFFCDWFFGIRWMVGVLEHWSVGVLDHWSIGWLGGWMVGALECWSVGVLEYWMVGVLDGWSIGSLEYWSVGWLDGWMTVFASRIALLVVDKNAWRGLGGFLMRRYRLKTPVR